MTNKVTPKSLAYYWSMFSAIQFEQPSIIICKQNQFWYKTLYNYNSSYYNSSYSQIKLFVQIKMEKFLFTFTQKNLSEFLVEQRVKSNEQRGKK